MEPDVAMPASDESPRRAYRYYDLVMAAFVTVLLGANLIGASKVAELWGFTFGAACSSSRSVTSSGTC